MNDTVKHYLDCWNAEDPTERRVLVERHWHPEARYVDPMVDVRGHDDLVAVIGAVQAQFPGLVFSALGNEDGHHDQVRFGWGLGPAGEPPVVEGFDVVVTSADGRIESVFGFLDKVPA